ncbi:hypothetical protein [Planotetraspora sp. GP83]|uniref:hypothetical protein n=1 Tax=Planotetraspora sp. GP83 TaxID=3156264 RepID=UPI003515F009
MRTSPGEGAAPLELLIPGGFAVVVLACAAVGALFPAAHTAARVTAMAVVTGVFGARARNLVATLVTAVMAAAFATGFLVNTTGELTFGGPDAARLVVFLAAGLLGAAYGRLRDLGRLRRRTRRLMRTRTHPRRAPVLARRLHLTAGTAPFAPPEAAQPGRGPTSRCPGNGDYS